MGVHVHRCRLAMRQRLTNELAAFSSVQLVSMGLLRSLGMERAPRRTDHAVIRDRLKTADDILMGFAMEKVWPWTEGKGPWTTMVLRLLKCVLQV